MKKNTAIAIILVFFLAQFGRMINYCLCTINVYQRTNSFSCDCERQLFAAIRTGNHSNQQPAQITIHTPAEDLFTSPAAAVFAFQQTKTRRVWPSIPAPGIFAVFSEGVFHPPLSFSSLS